MEIYIDVYILENIIKINQLLLSFKLLKLNLNNLKESNN